MNWLLLLVILILIAYAVTGLKRGLIKTIFSMCSVLLALILTICISPRIGKALQNNEKLYDTIKGKVISIIPEENIGDSEEEQDKFIDQLDLPKAMKDTLIKNNTSMMYEKFSTQDVKEYVANYVTCMAINALAYILTYIAIRILLSIICKTLDVISKLPLIRQVNQLAGLAIGLVQGLLAVWVLFLILTIFSGSAVGQQAFTMIDSSPILGFLYNNNILLGFVTSATKVFM